MEGVLHWPGMQHILCLSVSCKKPCTTHCQIIPLTFSLQDRGQGFQHCITDAANYVDALVKVHSTGRPRAQILDAYDQEMIARGGKAVEQSLSEAEKSLDMEAVKTMLMATKGHGR